MTMTVISLGGGVQSVTMTAMSILGDLDRADCAIFADTGWEREHTYRYLDWFLPWCEAHGFTVHVVSDGNIRDDAMRGDGIRWDGIPFYTRSEKGIGMLSRQCTNHYKLKPIRKWLRECTNSGNVEIWIGFSLDELRRVAPSRFKEQTYRFPLIEKRMRRGDCIEWLKAHNMPVPGKSACVCCPFRRNREWQEMVGTKEFEEVCQFDDFMRTPESYHAQKCNWPVYLHRSCQPLRERPFEQNVGQLLLWPDEECQGGCWL